MTADLEPTRINGRWTLQLPEHRARRPEWPWWEATRLAAMAHHLEHQGPQVVYDIGAEEGDLPALWASWGCEVVLVEPNPRVWPNIRAIFEANRLADRVVAWWVGFAGAETSPEITEVPAEDWPDCAYGEVIGDHGFLNLSERPDVAIISVDDLAEISGYPPTAITIDVEGAELEVLKGARQTLAGIHGRKPKVWVSIHPEFMLDMYGETGGVDAIRGFMRSLGYDEQFLAIDHEHHWMFLPR